MTSIGYKIISGFGECRKIHGSSLDTVRVEIDGVSDGFLTIGELSCRIKDGVGRIHLGLLSDGEYSPLLFTEGGVIRLEKIRKIEKRLARCEFDEELLSSILARLEEAEQRITLLESRVKVADEAIRGRIFLA